MKIATATEQNSKRLKTQRINRRRRQRRTWKPVSYKNVYWSTAKWQQQQQWSSTSNQNKLDKKCVQENVS